MMRLSTMLRVDATVDADDRSALAEQILSRWTHDAGSARFFRSSANVLYRFTLAGRPSFLRFADSSERRRDDVETEMDVVQALAAFGINLATPVRSKAGHIVETVETSLGTFHAVALQALDGSTLEVEDLDPAGLRAWGAALGRLHLAMSQLPRDLVAQRRTWRHDLATAAEHVPADRPTVTRELAAVTTALEALPDDPAAFGLIHFDFELDNLVWQDGDVGMLDFDDCAQYWYAADIVFAVGDLFDGPLSAADPGFIQFRAGYESVRDPGPAWLADAELFSRLGGLIQYARLKRALDLPAEADQPEWLATLRHKLSDRLHAYEASLR